MEHEEGGEAMSRSLATLLGGFRERTEPELFLSYLSNFMFLVDSSALHGPEKVSTCHLCMPTSVPTQVAYMQFHSVACSLDILHSVNTAKEGEDEV